MFVRAWAIQSTASLSQHDTTQTQGPYGVPSVKRVNGQGIDWIRKDCFGGAHSRVETSYPKMEGESWTGKLDGRVWAYGQRSFSVLKTSTLGDVWSSSSST